MNKSSFFTTIEDEARLSGLRVQSIFTDVARSIKSIFDKTTLISFDNGFSSQFQTDAIALENYMNLLNNNVSAEEAFNATMRESSIAAQEFANSLNATARSEEEMAAALANFANQQSMSQISMMAQNRSLSNVRLLLNEYNSGLQNCGLSQSQFIQSVGQSNSSLARYLNNVDSGKASMWGYVGSLVAAKAATIALRIATTALNAVIGMGIGLIVSFIMQGVQWVIGQIAEACKSAEEKMADLNTEFEELVNNAKKACDEFKTLKNSFNDTVPRFVELAKGVSEFGDNLTLTDEEYKEFLSLNNEIAEMFPSLNMGLDSNGNAMLNLSYNADTLTSSLQDLLEVERQAANQKIADSMPDLLDNITSQQKILNETTEGVRKGFYEEIKTILADLESQAADWQEEWGDQWKIRLRQFEGESVKSMMEDIFTAQEGDANEIWQRWENLTQKYLDSDGLIDWVGLLNSEEFTAAAKQIEEKFDRLDTKLGVAAKWKKVNSVANAWMQTDYSFLSLDDNMQVIAEKMLGKVDFRSLGKTTEEEIQAYINDYIITPLSNADESTKAAFGKILTISPEQYNSVTDYINSVKSAISEVANVSDSWDYDTLLKDLGYDEILTKYQSTIDSIKDKLPEVTDSMIASLSPSEVMSAFDYIESYGIKSWSELHSFIESKRFIDSFHVEDIDTLNDELKDLKSTFDSVSDIIDDYNEKRFYSLDNLKSLMDLEPEYLNTLIDENGQINLNTQAYKDYVAAKAKTLVVDQIKSLYEHLLEMSAEEAQAYANATAYNAETRSLEDLIGATTQYYLVLARAKDAKNNTTAYTDALRKSFGTVANYAAVYDSWLKSLSTSTNEFADKTDKSTDSLKQQKTALENQKKALENSKKSLENYKKGLDDAQDSLKDLIDLTIDYIKQIKENEKDALNKQKENFDELISKRKEALELAKKEREEADKLAEKQNSVVKAKLAFSIAQLDDSSAGKKAQKKAADNLKTANKDLSDYLNDREYNARVESLDKEKEAFDQNIDEQTKKIDEYLQNARQLYEDACNMIDNDTGDLYGKLWNDYVYPYTTKTRAEFDYLWNSAQIAIQKYQGDNETLIDVMNRLQGEIYATDTQINALDGEIDNLGGAIDSTNSALDSTSGVIDNVAVSLDGLGSSISDYIDQLNRLANTTVGDNTNKTSFWVNYNGKKYETGSHYNGDTKENRLLAANELTKLIAKDVSGFDNYGLSQIQAILGVGTNSKVHGWYYQFDGKTYTSTSQSKDNAVKQIRQQLASKYGNSSFVLDQVYGKIQKYAEGTRAAHGGLSIVDEEGLFSEFIPYQIGKGRYSFLPEGNPVFSKAMTNTLFDFASDPAKYANSIINNSTRKSGDTTFSSAPVYHIYGNVDDSTLQRIDKQEKKRYELFKKQFMLEMLRENKNL